MTRLEIKKLTQNVRIKLPQDSLRLTFFSVVVVEIQTDIFLF